MTSSETSAQVPRDSVQRNGFDVLSFKSNTLLSKEPRCAFLAPIAEAGITGHPQPQPISVHTSKTSWTPLIVPPLFEPRKPIVRHHPLCLPSSSLEWHSTTVGLLSVPPDISSLSASLADKLTEAHRHTRR